MSAKPTFTLNEVLTAMLFSRASLFGIIDPKGRDINKECGYPDHVTIEQLRQLYEREGPATRVVQVLPSETWSVNPELYEVEDATKTPFELAWDELQLKFNIWSYLHRVDELSGIGHYGVLLLGVDDNKDLSEPIDTIDERGEQVANGKKYNLIFLRAFDEYLVRVDSYQSDPTNPRFGQPLLYDIQFADPGAVSGTNSTTLVDTTRKKVHWSRIIHVADNRKSSEVFGVPRMLPVLNRIYDLRKVLGGSSEMLWKGGFPGYSFETTPEVNAGDLDIDTASLKKQIEAYQNGLQRYLALQGVSAKSLAPQVADPSNHIEQNLRIIAMTLGVPLRIFLGSEAAHLASTQDTGTWNRRLGQRQEIYVTPMIIRPTVDRLMMIGVLPKVKQYFVSWKDLNTLTESEKADISLKRSQALLAYISSGSEVAIPPLEFWTNIMGMTLDQAVSIVEAAKKNADKMTTVDQNPPAPTSAQQGTKGNPDQNPGPPKPANPGSAAAA